MYSVPVQELFTDWYDNYPASTECIVDTKIGEGGIIYLTRIRYHQTQRVHQYFSNQLVSTYQDKFKCIAKLKEDGTIEWDPQPKYELTPVPGKCEGFAATILRIEEVEPYHIWLVVLNRGASKGEKGWNKWITGFLKQTKLSS